MLRKGEKSRIYLNIERKLDKKTCFLNVETSYVKEGCPKVPLP